MIFQKSHSRPGMESCRSSLPKWLPFVWMVLVALVPSFATALEFKDLQGYWAGKAVQSDPENGKILDTIPVTIHAFTRNDANVVLYNISGICVGVKPSYREDGFSFVWGGVTLDLRLVEGNLEFDHPNEGEVPPWRVKLSKEPSLNLTDEQISGTFAGRLENALGAAGTRHIFTYDVEIEIQIKGSEAYAAIKGTRFGSRGEVQETYKTDFVQVERYGSRLILWTQTPEESKEQKARMVQRAKSKDPEKSKAFIESLEQERVYLNMREDGADIQFNIQTFGNAVGTLKRVKKEDSLEKAPPKP